MTTFQWNLPDKWVLPIALVIFLFPVISTEYNVLSFTHGVFSYPFDDAFIHLAIAKNIAVHGVWGISPHEFTSASSSVLYPLLLAGCMKIFGPVTALPLIINILAGIALVVVVRKWLAGQGLDGLAQLLSLVALILLTPLPAIVVFGMEHTLQILFDFLFIYSFAAAWGKRRSLPWTVYLYGVLVTGIRYEGMFLIAGACLLLFFQQRTSITRRIIPTAKLGLIAFLPILIFGIYAMSKGGLFIPNSVLVKSTTPPLTAEGLSQFFTTDVYNQIYLAHPTIGGIAIHRLLILLPVSYLLFAGQLNKVLVGILILLTFITITHLIFASTVILYRYEAYLIACALPVLCALTVNYSSQLVTQPVLLRWAALFIVIILAIPIALRSKATFVLMDQGAINIYEQQYQMGQFVKKYYNNTPIAMGDIGAISFYAQGKSLDLEGLGNLEMAKARKYNYRTPEFYYDQCKKNNVRIAIVFDRAYPWQLLQRWYKVAIWQIPNNVACYSDVVSFYAMDSTGGPELKGNLQAFQPNLPADVQVRYR